MLGWLLSCRVGKILIDRADYLVEPLPVLRDGLEDDGITLAANTDFIRLEAKFLWESNRLGPSTPEYLRSFHNILHEIYQKYISSLMELQCWVKLDFRRPKRGALPFSPSWPLKQIEAFVGKLTHLLPVPRLLEGTSRPQLGIFLPAYGKELGVQLCKRVDLNLRQTKFAPPAQESFFWVATGAQEGVPIFQSQFIRRYPIVILLHSHEAEDILQIGDLLACRSGEIAEAAKQLALKEADASRIPFRFGKM